ncbi:alpha/beta fold hydrolase [Beijerinckia indica]|uniref:Alpha/beta hydrolase fold n=1 Tax=Beijerinckia indica subsp. indica (strain ATCC 9039 / DSM 1715 / NCIMB 8712) TaxID=395963 RepID=B2IIV4_BEII9|nr:alpha/beta hydrolase [Beijerinckia indica]ACB96166.1 alpha/beta hydrolase fold [Beijerinckia indica subsp. indica ATCC 9039]
MTSDYTETWADAAQIDYISLSSNRRLRYLRSGTGSPLVLMHTLRTQLDYFQRLIPLLTDRFTVYAVDLPGLGWSDIRPGVHYEEPAIRRDMVEFIEKLALTDLTVAGESMGATLALSIAAELGSRVKRVVALNTYDYPQGVERANILASVVIKMMRIPGIGLMVSKLENELILSGILRGGFYDPKMLPKDFVKELIRSGHRAGYPGVETAYLHALNSFIAARKVYGRISAPVTLVYGDHDWSKPAEREAVARLVPGSQMLTLARTGHFASLEHPDQVAKILIGAAAEN